MIRLAAINGDYAVEPHAQGRSFARQITQPEYDYILRVGDREPKKDEFKEQFNSWNYAVRGKTVDGRDIRVCVYFEGKMVVVTLIAVGEEG